MKPALIIGSTCVDVIINIHHLPKTEEDIHPTSQSMAIGGCAFNAAYMVRLLKIARANNVRVRMIGERSRFDQDIIDGINRLERETENNTGLTFVIAVNYGGRDEIVRAARKIMKDTADGKITPDQMDEAAFSSYLDTAEIPDPDLLIRTSGELRLSNYLLWQLAYTELYVTDCYWPDFNKEELKKAIAAYNSRDRRFGGVK